MRKNLDKHPIRPIALWVVPTVGVLVAFEVAFSGWDVRRWHVIYGSAWLTAVVGTWLARDQSERFSGMLERLVNRAALERHNGPLSRDELSILKHDLIAKQRSWARRASASFGLAAAASMFTVVVFQYQDVFKAIVGALLGGVGGILAGQPLGRMMACGQLTQSLARQGLSTRATPGHVDGAAGLKPLGDYYIYQSLLLAIPATFCLIWSLVFIADSSPEYDRLRPWYLATLAVFICVELAGFALPLSGVHEMMKRQKKEALADTDTVLISRIIQARNELEQDIDPERRALLRDQLEQLTRSYVEIEKMPTWPIDRALRQRLTLGNIALIIPLFIQVVTFATRS